MLGTMVEILSREPTALAAELLGDRARLLVFGEAGVGKSFLAGQLADACSLPCSLVNANIGSPALGPPGCVWRARRHRGSWHIEDTEALCTLDAGRFRLPLTVAVARILKNAPPGPTLIEAPGVSRGTLAFELLIGLVQAGAVDTVVMVNRDPDEVDLPPLPARIVMLRAAAEAEATSKSARAIARTAQWDRYLDDATAVAMPMPPAAGPPLPDDCAGCQIALLDKHGRTLALGEVIAAGDQLRVRIPSCDATAVRAFLVRDARRNGAGLLATGSTNERAPTRGRAEIELNPDATSDMVAAREEIAEVNVAPISAHAASARVVLINGLLGDPTLHLRFRHQRRSLLFDVGEAARLQARIAHQVSDLFVSHAHVDHIGGFLWLLRSRIGVAEPCRVFGPPGMTDRIAGMLGAIEWDRVGDRAPIFDVSEVDGNRLISWRLRAGDAERCARGQRAVTDGVLLEEPGFRVRAATLDHGDLPVLAFALEESVHLNVRKERIEELNIEPGPWLETLKHRVHAGELDSLLELPDGSCPTVRELGDRLLLERPGEKVVYATDLADSPGNRDALVALARHAHTLFCEAAFADEDIEQARATGHLTARACAEIATAADVGQLIPFHLSRRYEREPERLLAEVCRGFAGTFVPPSLRDAVAAARARLT